MMGRGKRGRESTWGRLNMPDHSLRGSGFTNRPPSCICGCKVSGDGLGFHRLGGVVASIGVELSLTLVGAPRACPGLKPIFIIIESALFSVPRPEALSSSARSNRLLESPSSRDSSSSCLVLFVLFCSSLRRDLRKASLRFSL